MMNSEQITVSVDPIVATAYRGASDVERRKLDLLVNLRLLDAMRSDESLEEIMQHVSENAQRRGLTPTILDSLIDE